MPSPEDAPVIQTDPTVVSTLGHASLGGNIDVRVPFEIQADGVEPAAYAPAKATPYLGKAKRGPNIHDAPGQADEAIAYVRTIFPDSNFSFLGAGRYGVVLADDTGKAFKVYRSALLYSKYEKEAGALQLLSDAGLAPKLHLFV
ncbi:MAG: hypothetical protein AAB834_05315, partial [Patescibacteria group bacterium]